MNKKKVNFSTVKNSAIVFDGGLNENVSSLDLKAGELIEGYNYQLTEGTEGGYVSIQGYERYDGRPKPSDTQATEADHTARDAARALIQEVPGDGPILGLYIYLGKVYAFRNHTDNLSAKMWVESSTGWVEIDTSGVTLNPDGNYNFITYNFLATSLTKYMYWADGVSKAHQFDGTSVVPLDNIGMDPNDKPVNLVAKDNRIFLAYPTGSLQYSALGLPLDWTSGTAGEIGLGQEITNIVSGVGNSIIIFGRNSIKTLQGNTPDNWVLDTFSELSGARDGTGYRMLGTVYYLDDRGLTSLEATDAFGDFVSNSISQRVKKTLLQHLDKVTTSTVARDLNQYRIFLDEGSSFFFSFLNKELQGVTLIKYPISVNTTTEGEDADGKAVIYFGSTDGFVYQMDQGTSFDGEPIETMMRSAYYPYKSPRNWKRFQAVTFEIAGNDAMEFTFYANFDYSQPESPRGLPTDIAIRGAGVRYGEGVWGSMIWGGSDVTNRVRQYVEGIGTNMSIKLTSEGAYTRPHTIQNAIVDWKLLGRQM